jgi:formamidopyrimidine-DNA glycosylase
MLALRVVCVSDAGEFVGAIDVTEAGTQKRLAAYLVSDLAEVPGVAALGPDPLDPRFTQDVLHGILQAAGRAQLKGVLRDQARIAGIGNAYSDEILHVAGISPYAPASALPAATEERLYQAIGETLREAVAVAMSADPTQLKAEKKAAMRVHGRTGQPCPTCGDTVREVSFADSSLQYCPTCQTGGKVLADRRMSRLLK